MRRAGSPRARGLMRLRRMKKAPMSRHIAPTTMYATPRNALLPPIQLLCVTIIDLVPSKLSAGKSTQHITHTHTHWSVTHKHTHHKDTQRHTHTKTHTHTRENFLRAYCSLQGESSRRPADRSLECGKACGSWGEPPHASTQ